MFSKLSKFRTKGSSRSGSLRSHQGKDYHYGHNDIEYSRYSFSSGMLYPIERPPGVPISVHLARSPVSLPLQEKNTMPIPSVAPLIENYDPDTDDDVSLAECLFPSTPPDFSPGPSLGAKRLSPLVYDTMIKPVEMNGKRSDQDNAMIIKKSWSSKDVEMMNSRSEDMVVMDKVWSLQDVDDGLRTLDRTRVVDRSSMDLTMSKKSWASQDVEGFSDSSINTPIINRGGVFENVKDVGIESRRAIWEANYKQVWVPDGLESGTTRSLLSSPLQEEGIDTCPAVLPSYEDAEDEFLEEFEGYFSNLQVDNVRRIQYPKLEIQKLVYLDYANFSLFSNFQVEEHLKILLEHGPCLGSASFSSFSDNPLFKHVAETQNRLLSMLNTTANHYSIIFTAGFQESFRLVAESYPFQKGSPLLVCQDNHAIVREVVRSAQRAGGKPILFPVTEKELCFHSHNLHKHLRHHGVRDTNNGGLFVYPAQSNLSGMKHSLGWVVEAQQNGWSVCLDASTFLPTNSLDLDIHQPDLIIGSFHHMIGYPSGMGFLLVRRESFCVQATPSGERVQFHRNKPADEGEHCHIMCPADNTMNLLQFAALNLGLIQLELIGFSSIQKRVRSLALWLVKRLRTLKHKDGDQPSLLRIYGSHAAKDRGSIVSFNVMDPSGTVLPPDIVRKLAARCNIQLSVGNFHNPGLSNLLEGQPNDRFINDCSVLEGVSGFTAVRASFGAVSNFADVYRLVEFLLRFRDEEYLATEAIVFVEERFNQMQ